MVAEGFVDREYLDPAGIPTIGVGFTREHMQKTWPGQAFDVGATMSKTQADDCQIYLVDQ